VTSVKAITYGHYTPWQIVYESQPASHINLTQLLSRTGDHPARVREVGNVEVAVLLFVEFEVEN
jgi:hypothetical protein